MYEDVQKEKEALVVKIAAMEVESTSLKEQLGKSQESSATAVKVSCLQMFSGSAVCVSGNDDIRRVRDFKWR